MSLAHISTVSIEACASVYGIKYYIAKYIRYSSRASLQHALVKTRASQEFLRGT